MKRLCSNCNVQTSDNEYDISCENVMNDEWNVKGNVNYEGIVGELGDQPHSSSHGDALRGQVIENSSRDYRNDWQNLSIHY